ncbi:hypothetical protein [Pseudomonas oryzihabitans]
MHGTGLDNIDLDAARDLNVPVLNTRGRNASLVDEHAITLMSALNK